VVRILLKKEAVIVTFIWFLNVWGKIKKKTKKVLSEKGIGLICKDPSCLLRLHPGSHENVLLKGPLHIISSFTVEMRRGRRQTRGSWWWADGPWPWFMGINHGQGIRKMKGSGNIIRD